MKLLTHGNRTKTANEPPRWLRHLVSASSDSPELDDRMNDARARETGPDHPLADSGHDPELADEGPDPEPGSESTGEPTSEPEALPLDQVFGLLKNKRRRTVLRYLDEHEEPVSIGEVSEHIAADENDIPVSQVSSRERKCAYVGLYQCHLPKMDDTNVIVYNRDRGLVETGPNAAQLKQYLDRTDASARPWPLYYAAVAGTGLAATLSIQLLVGGATPVLALCLATMVAVTGTAVFHHQTERQETERAGE